MHKRDVSPHLIGAILSLLILSWSVVACAQGGKGASSSLKSAGDEAKFRVISRFPADKSSKTNPLGADAAPLVDDAVRDAIVEERFDVALLLVQKKADDVQKKANDVQKKTNDVQKKTSEDDPYVDLLEGFLAYRADKPKEALEKLEALAGKVDTLEDYRLYWLAQSAVAAEKQHKAALSAAQISSDSLLLGRSLILLANALLDAGTASDTERAIKTLELYLTKYPRGRSAEDARVALAGAYEKTKKWDAAAKTYLTVLEAHPLTESATTAERRLDAIKKHLSDEVKAQVDEPSLAIRMSRYRGLFRSHRSKKVIAGLKGELDGLKDDKERRCESLYLIAKSYSKLRQHSDGSEWYERIVEECKGTEYVLKALYLGGKGHWNSGKRDEAKKWFARIWKEFSDHSFADDAMYFVARILREEKKADDARKLLAKQVSSYPSGDMAKDAHWLLVREMFADDKYKEIVAYVDKLEDTGEDDVYSRGRLHYFRARALEKLQKTDDAKKGYREIAQKYPLSYYAYLAFSRLGHLEEGDKKGGRAGVSDLCSLQNGKLCSFVGPKRTDDVELPASLRKAAHFERGVMLLRLGLTDLAEDEFQALRRSHGSAANLWALTFLLDAAGAYRISHDLTRRHIHGWKTAYPKNADDPRWSLAFPTPFRQLVDKYVTKRKLPRALVYAIMREESGFNPRIESWANARGLLQLMESTASNVAKEDGMTGFSVDKLLEPATNIRLGTGYIAELAEQLDGHPALVIAGYNGGHGNVSRWLKKRGDLPLDLWVEDIPYGQTRKYTKRVLASFWTYSWMYGRDRVPRLSFELPDAD